MATSLKNESVNECDGAHVEEVCAGKSPEEKVVIVKQETEKAKTLFVGDGINGGRGLWIAEPPERPP
jgi:cation transport ATPase